MTEDRVSPETLQLASDKEIDWQTELLSPDEIGNPLTHRIPTQSLFQKFLREKYGVNIIIQPSCSEYNIDTISKYDSSHNMNLAFDLNGLNFKDFSSYEAALESALQKAIELI